MVMDGENIESDLHALKRLYGLLRKNGDGTSNTASDMLDEHARLLLKNLLDAATKKVLKENIAGQVEPPSGIQPNDLSKELTTLPKLSMTAEDDQSCEKELDSDKNRKINGLDINLWKEQKFTPQSLASGPEYRRKRCRVCQRNTVKQLESTEETQFYDAPQDSNRYADRQNNNSLEETGLLSSNKTDESKGKTGLIVSDLNGAGYTDLLSDRIVEAKSEPEEVDCLSREASKAIEQIELCISAFLIGAQCKFPMQKVNKIHVDDENVNAIADTNESRNWIMSRSNFVPSWVPNVQNFNPNEISYRTPNWPSALKIENPYQRHTAIEDESTRLSKLLQIYKPSDSFMNLKNRETLPSIGSGINVTSTLGACSENHLPKRPSELLDTKQKDGIRKNRHYITAARTSVQHGESEGTATDSCSSSWTSQQTSSRDGDSSEEYSLTNESSRELQYITSSGTSPSCLSHGTGSQYSSCTSNSGDEVYSSISSREVTSSSSSKSEGYVSHNQAIRRPTYLWTTKKSGPSKNNKSGMWKRLKDRLAIIFHHHHHHHHHTLDDCDNNDQTKMSRNTSFNKHKGKVVSSERQDEEAYGERAVEKMRKSLSSIHEKNQQRHFQGLMKGLVKHVEHSKKSKPVKETAGQLAKTKHSRNKTLNKSHWWQLLKHHRKGAKLPNKAHVKLGLGKKRAHSKALPKIK